MAYTEAEKKFYSPQHASSAFYLPVSANLMAVVQEWTQQGQKSVEIKLLSRFGNPLGDHEFRAERLQEKPAALAKSLFGSVLGVAGLSNRAAHRMARDLQTHLGS